MTTTNLSSRRAGRMRWAASLGAVAVAMIGLLASPAIAMPQQQDAKLLRQLEVFEKLLTETLHEFVNDRVNEKVNSDLRAMSGAEDETGPGAEHRLVVRIGSAAAAHGVYLDGYGVIFSIQMPQVSVIPQSFEIRLAEPLQIIRISPDPETSRRRLSAGMIEFRANRIRQSLQDLEELLHREQEEGVETGLNDEQLRQIKELQVSLEKLARIEESEPDVVVIQERVESGEEIAAEKRSQAVLSRVDESRQYYRNILDLQRSTKKVMEQSHRHVAEAVNEAAIETLAQYGSVIKGLDSDDRISVLIFTPTRPFFGRIHEETGLGREEYVISVRYKDIRDLDNQKIDLEEFRTRVRIHTRLGTELDLSTREQ